MPGEGLRGGLAGLCPIGELLLEVALDVPPRLARIERYAAVVRWCLRSRQWRGVEFVNRLASLPDHWSEPTPKQQNVLDRLFEKARAR